MLPWGAMLRAALSAGLSVEAFWRLSLREWRWLADRSGDVLGGAELHELMRAFPDEEKKGSRDDGI